MERKRNIINITETRQITIPDTIDHDLGFADQAECEVRGNELVIRPVHTTRTKSDDEDNIKREDNMKLLSEIKETQSDSDEDYVSDDTLSNALQFVFNVIRQPMVYRTRRDSIQFEYELSDRSYLEFEIFKDKATCMLVPERVYERASFPDVDMKDMKTINRIVGDFYGAK